MSNSWIDSGDGTGICCEADADNNLLQLKLKKPQAWKWELTTSRSSPNITMPRIMLFNHKGRLLVDANQQVDDAVYRAEKRAPKPPKPPKRKGKRLLRSVTTNLETLQDDEDTGLGSLDSAEKHSYKPLSKVDPSYEMPVIYRNPLDNVSRIVAMGEKRNVNDHKAWRNSAPDEIDFGSLQICEVTDTDQSLDRGRAPSLPEEDVNINTPWRRKWSIKEKGIEPPKRNKKQLQENQLGPSVAMIASDIDNSPDRLYISKATWKPFLSNGHLDATTPVVKPFERRASSFKEVRFTVHPASDEEEQKPREKRRYRRSNTSGRPSITSSGSILERLSAMKCRLSSPEFETAENNQIQIAPRYFLRTSRAGTIVVAEETLKQRRTRRRPPKTSSNENVLSPSNSSLPNGSFKQAGLLGATLGVPCSQSQSMKNFNEFNGNRPRRKVIPIRRHKSDGNMLLATSSDDDKQRDRSRNRNSVRHRRNVPWRHNQEDANKQTELAG